MRRARYARCMATGRFAATPRRARSITFDARLTTRKAPPRFVATTLSKSSSVMRSSSVSFVMPALATTISTGPSVASTWVNAASTDAASVTGPHLEAGRRALAGSAASRLDEGDQALRLAALAVADTIREPGFAAHPDVMPAQTAVVGDAERALAAADAALKAAAK